MRHQIAGRKLGRTTAHRWALFNNQLASLIDHERIETTLHKAKELRGFADRLITLAKKDTLAARRQVFDSIRNQTLVKKLFTEIAPRFREKNGGYTRVLKLGYRLGDSAPMALIEYVEGKILEVVGGNTKPAKAVKKTPAKKTAPKKEKTPKKTNKAK